MPRYSYTARDPSGQSVSAMLEAPTRKEALRLLAVRGLSPLSVSEADVRVGGPKSKAGSRKTQPLGSPDKGARPSTFAARPARGAVRLRRAQRLPFLQALYDLTASGLSAGEAVRLLSQRIQNPALRALCAGLWERVGEGLPLSRAMGEFPAVFDNSTISLLQAGEATGNVTEVLQRLIQHFTEQNELRQKLLTAMAYPVFICLVAFGVILFFIFGLLPKLELLLSSLGGKLPRATQFLIDTSHFLISYGWMLGTGLVFAAIAFWRWRATEAGRVVTDAWILRLPLAGPFAASATVMNFSQTLAVLLENGITTAEALRMTERVIGNRTHRAAFAEATRGAAEAMLAVDLLESLPHLQPAHTMPAHIMGTSTLAKIRGVMVRSPHSGPRQLEDLPPRVVRGAHWEPRPGLACWRGVQDPLPGETGASFECGVAAPAA